MYSRDNTHRLGSHAGNARFDDKESAMSLRRACTTIGLIVGVAMMTRTAAAAYWTGWASPGYLGLPGNYVYCNAWDEAARGVGCSGTNCGSMRVECEQMPNGIALDSTTDYWTDFFSE